MAASMKVAVPSDKVIIASGKVTVPSDVELAASTEESLRPGKYWFRPA